MDETNLEAEASAAFDPYVETKALLDKELSVIQSAEVDLTPIIESRLYLEKCIQEVEYLLQSSNIANTANNANNANSANSSNSSNNSNNGTQGNIEKPDQFANNHSNISNTNIPQPSSNNNASNSPQAPYPGNSSTKPQQQRTKTSTGRAVEVNDSKSQVKSKSRKQIQTPAEVELTWKPFGQFSGHLNTVRSVIFLSSQILATGGDDGTIKRWDLSLNKNAGRKKNASIVCQTHRGHQGAVSALAYDPITDYLFSSGQDRTICVWIEDRVPPIIQFGGHQGVIWDLAIHIESRLLASASSDGTVKIWDISHDTTIESLVMTVGYQGDEAAGDALEGGGSSDIPTATTVAFMEDGHKLVIGYDNAALHVIEVKTGAKILELANNLDKSGTTNSSEQDALNAQASSELAATGVVFCENNKTVVSVHNNGLIRVFDAGSGELLKEWRGHDGAASCISVSPDGKELITGGSEGLVKYWNVEQDYKESQVLEVHDPNASEGVLRVAWYNSDECGDHEPGTKSKCLTASVGGDTNLYVYEKGI